MRFSLLALALAPFYSPETGGGGGGGTPIDPVTAARLGLAPRSPEVPREPSPSDIADAAPASPSDDAHADAPAAAADPGEPGDAGGVGGADADAADAAAGERGGRGVDGDADDVSRCPIGDGTRPRCGSCAAPGSCPFDPPAPPADEEHEVQVDVVVQVTEDGHALPPITMSVAAAYRVPGELHDFVQGFRFGARSALSTLLGSGRLF